MLDMIDASQSAGRAELDIIITALRLAHDIAQTERMIAADYEMGDMAP